MFSRSRIGILVIVAVVTVGFIFCDNSSATVISTPEEYIDYLIQEGKTTPSVLNTKKQFEKLSVEKQLRVIKYITDIKTLNKISTHFFAEPGYNLQNQDIRGKNYLEETSLFRKTSQG